MYLRRLVLVILLGAFKSAEAHAFARASYARTTPSASYIKTYFEEFVIFVPKKTTHINIYITRVNLSIYTLPPFAKMYVFVDFMPTVSRTSGLVKNAKAGEQSSGISTGTPLPVWKKIPCTLCVLYCSTKTKLYSTMTDKQDLQLKFISFTGMDVCWRGSSQRKTTCQNVWPPYPLTYTHCQSWGSIAGCSGEQQVYWPLRYSNTWIVEFQVTMTILVLYLLFLFCNLQKLFWMFPHLLPFLSQSSTLVMPWVFFQTLCTPLVSDLVHHPLFSCGYSQQCYNEIIKMHYTTSLFLIQQNSVIAVPDPPNLLHYKHNSVCHN